MKISELATENVVTIDPKASILEAARLMRELHVGDVVLVQEKGSERVPVGLVTDRDIVVGPLAQEVDFGTLSIGDIATQKLVVADADEEVSDVARRMLAQGIRRLPLVNSLGALVGIVTYDDLVAWMADELSDFTRMFARQRRREELSRR